MTSVIPYDPLFQVWTELQGLFIGHLLVLTFDMFYDKYNRKHNFIVWNQRQQKVFLAQPGSAYMLHYKTHRSYFDCNKLPTNYNIISQPSIWIFHVSVLCYFPLTSCALFLDFNLYPLKPIFYNSNC